jgi:hypothetical protein
MFKKLLISNLIFIFSLGNVFAYSDEVLNNLELKKYGQIFEYESLSERLNRLETDYFGMSQSGDLDDRISKLSQISINSRTYPSAYPYENYKPKKATMRTFWDNFSSLFDSGSITGFTPPMSVYGYSPMQENIYRQQYLDFLNNPQSYCPYHNRYNYFPQNRLNSSYPYSINHSPIRHDYMGNYPINRYYRPNFYNPPNIYTGAGVHIIND